MNNSLKLTFSQWGSSPISICLDSKGPIKCLFDHESLDEVSKYTIHSFQIHIGELVQELAK